MTITDVPSFAVVTEQSYPLLVGIAAGIAVLVASPAPFAYAHAHEWRLGELYFAGFDFSAVATSFLFTFYTFVVTAERGFIARMRHSIYYARLIRYTVTALMLGVGLAVASIPLLVTDPLPASRWDIASLAITGWVFLATWTVAAFVRTTRLFIAFATGDS